MTKLMKAILLLSVLLVCAFSGVGQQAGNSARLSLDWAAYSVGGASTMIPVRLDSAGGERTVSFSVAWNRTGGMRYVRVDLGEGAPADAVLTIDRRKAEAGRVGITVTSASGFAAGSRVIARLIGQGRSDDVNSAQLSVNYVNSPTPIRITKADGTVVAADTVGNSYVFGVADPGSLLSVDDLSAAAGATVTVPVQLRRALIGFFGMTNVSFSLQWDPAFVEFRSAQTGAHLPAGAVVKFDESMVAQGRLGVSVVGSTPFVDAEPYNPVTLVLQVRPDAPRGLYAVSFTGTPTPYTGSNANGQPTGPGWVAGFINTGVTYSWVDGIVTTPELLRLRNAKVVLTDDVGFSEILTTSSLGNFRFESLPNLSNYTITVQSKRYRFAPFILQPTPGLMPPIELRGLE